MIQAFSPINDKLKLFDFLLDMEFKVYPEANFLYLFGVTEVDCYGVIDLQTHKTVLFVPKLPIDLKLWMIVFDLESFR